MTLSQFVQAIVAGIIIGAWTSINSWLQARKIGRDAEMAATIVADKVEHVRETLVNTTSKSTQKLDDLKQGQAAQAKTLEGQNKVAAATFELVNSPMAKLLKDYSEITRWKADKTGLAVDKDRAKEALEAYEIHQERQAKVDQMPGTMEEKSGKAPI